MDEALYKKLFLHKFGAILIENLPDDLREFDGVAFDTTPAGNYDMALRFVFSLDEMENAINETAERGNINPGGYLYLAYPKKGNKRYDCAIAADDITRRFGLETGDGFYKNTRLKFSKMVSLNPTFTIIGLRLR